MTLPSWTNNPNTSLSTTQIQTEFGGTAPTDLSEYYRNGTSGYVVGERVGFPNGVSTPIPVFGNPLAISNFYGASAVGYAITTDKPNYNEGETITINVTAPVLNGTVLYWTIDDATSTITISPTTLSNGTKGGAQGEAYSRQLTASGGTAPYTFSILVGSLPAGLSLSSGGLISGSPTSAGVTTFTVQAIDNEGNGGVRQYSLSVVNVTYLPATLPSGTQASAYSQQLSVSGGTAPYAYSLIGSLPAGLSLSSTGLISGTPTTNGTFSTSIRATFNGGEQGINISYTNWVINPVPTYGASTIGPNPLPTGYATQSYSQQLTFTGDVVGPVVFVHAATPNQTYSGNGQPYFSPLPVGISLSSAGLLSGTIGLNELGLFPIWVKATDSRQHSVTSELSWPVLRVTNGTGSGKILPASLPAGTRNTAYSQQISVDRIGTYQFASTGSLPAGLSLTLGGLLSGTPTVNGTFTVSVVAGYDTTDNNPANDYDTYTATYSLVINNPVSLSISPTSLPIANHQVNNYSQQLSASGGTAPYTYNITNSYSQYGNFPIRGQVAGSDQLDPNNHNSGIALSSTGLISGNPIHPPATYNFDVTVTDANGNTGSRAYTLDIRVPDFYWDTGGVQLTIGNPGRYFVQGVDPDYAELMAEFDLNFFYSLVIPYTVNIDFVLSGDLVVSDILFMYSMSSLGPTTYPITPSLTGSLVAPPYIYTAVPHSFARLYFGIKRTSAIFTQNLRLITLTATAYRTDGSSITSAGSEYVSELGFINSTQ